MPPRVLIVDDSPLVRSLLRKCLESEPGWQVCGEAVNGREAIERAQAVHPNFIVLDLSMPVMNGLEAARILSRLMPAVPMIIFTSFITLGLKQQALAAGVCRVIAKDGPLSDLILAVRSLMAADTA
ncbi:MAG TPA: response regulator transcription factor [Terriglobales bacterium]|nr:response regulator transcription factor [Terriglobales bacterium]